MKSATFALFLMSFAGSVFASTCETPKAQSTEEVSTDEEQKKELDKVQPEPQPAK